MAKRKMDISDKLYHALAEAREDGLDFVEIGQVVANFIYVEAQREYMLRNEKVRTAKAGGQ